MRNRNNERAVSAFQSIEGHWQLILDAEGTFESPAFLPSKVSRMAELPGSLDVQCIGNPVTVETDWTATIFDRSFYEAKEFEPYRVAGQVKVPYCLQPKSKYVGAAWYRGEITLPHSWSSGEIQLFLERPHGETTVWLNDLYLGSENSLSTSHRFPVSNDFAGRTMTLVVRVDNTLKIPVGENAHSVSDHTQGNWNGIIGRIGFAFTAPQELLDLRVLEASGHGLLRISGKVLFPRGDSEVVLRLLDIAGEGQSLEQVLEARISSRDWDDEGRFVYEAELKGRVEAWDEFNPKLYELRWETESGTGSLQFGFRSIETLDTRFAVNGRPAFLRGVLDCCIFPLTGHPPMEDGEWNRIFGQIKDCGFNHIRFHSWCPPEYAFKAADRLGLYLQVECAVWPNSDAVLGFNSPKGIGDGELLDEWAIREGEHILEEFGHHPSFIALACGNEPGGKGHRDYLETWVEHFKTLDTTRLICGTAGWPRLDRNDFQIVPEPRIHQWGDGLGCRLNAQSPATLVDYREIVRACEVPIVSHEIGQWCSFPSLAAANDYQGHLSPTALRIVEDRLDQNGLIALSEEFHYASGRLQLLCYKEEIESSLRTPGLAGFQLLGLQDFPGQGTAPVGLLDAFWREKSYCAPLEIRRFCQSTVVLARLPKRVFCSEECVSFDIETAHFGKAPLSDVTLQWCILDSANQSVAQGSLKLQTVALGHGKIAQLDLALPVVDRASRFKLQVGIVSREAEFVNDWDFWIFSERSQVETDGVVKVVSKLCDALALLENGETVLLASSGVANEIALGFTPIFWNTACTQGQAPHTLGIYCDEKHPALAEFPTDGFTDWQWWYLLHEAGVITLEGELQRLRPIVRVIDDWATCRSLAFLVEARVGAGKLLMCSADLVTPTKNREAGLVRQQFLASLLQYAQSESFSPSGRVEANDLRQLFKDTK